MLAVEEEDGGMYMEIIHSVSAASGHWKTCRGVLCDRKMSLKLKWKTCRTVLMPILMHGAYP